MQDVNNRETVYRVGQRKEGIWELILLSAQVFSKAKTALKSMKVCGPQTYRITFWQGPVF